MKIRCPECGAVQDESASAVSTYCRTCSAHIEIGEPPPPPPVRPIHRPPRGIEIHCHACGHSHEIAPKSRATTCPYCSAGIEIGERIITGVCSRSVDLRGRLVVGEGARLSAPRIICTDARLEGPAAGTLFCENEARLACSGRLTLAIFAKTLVVEKHAEIALAYPACSDNADIRGSLSGSLFVRGALRVARGGAFCGALRARTLAVDRGGRLQGPVCIGPGEPLDAPAPPADIIPLNPASHP